MAADVSETKATGMMKEVEDDLNRILKVILGIWYIKYHRFFLMKKIFLITGTGINVRVTGRTYSIFCW